MMLIMMMMLVSHTINFLKILYKNSLFEAYDYCKDRGFLTLTRDIPYDTRWLN